MASQTFQGQKLICSSVHLKIPYKGMKVAIDKESQKKFGIRGDDIRVNMGAHKFDHISQNKSIACNYKFHKQVMQDFNESILNRKSS